jgi:hypothetical protein
VVIDDLTWPEQFPRICQLAEIMLCIGLSCGTMGEIVWTKWVGGPPVVVIEPLISSIPPEIIAETDVRLVADLEGFWEVVDSVGFQLLPPDLRHCCATGNPAGMDDFALLSSLLEKI